MCPLAFSCSFMINMMLGVINIYFHVRKHPNALISISYMNINYYKTKVTVNA